MDIVRVGFGFSFTLSYPVVLFEARHNLDMLVFTDPVTKVRENWEKKR